ncbi:IS30 family transposase [Rhodohalobacter sp.]|uniref:IS30 family transposase n=1 Tax=Rhodohalobacter sp. TaxID=1974210 RepID=UPI002ACE6D4F|nr:IS30 family transposase [Rhodohalobacter sp.]MDZ7755192.1 IS30 family transposase [Rhodohalobacter sp.]
MQKYKQLDLQDRHKMKALLEAGHSKTKIAEIIGVHKSTISRELSRNVSTRGRYANEYRPQSAQRKTDQRHRDKRKHCRFTEDLKQEATEWLEEEKLSPELISGRWAVRGIDGVSHEAIYQWIWRGKHQKDPVTRELYTHLKHGRRRRKRGNYNDSRGILTGRVSIEERPEIVEERTRLGDLEADFMIGKAHKSALLVITDRATLLTRLEKVSSREADPTETTIEKMLATVPKAFIKTLTLDNDKGFANHQEIGKKLDADVYFTRPYTSQDKGTVENRIGVIRQFFPKGTDLRDVSTQQIKIVERHLNNRPIRKFDYLSPIQQTLKYRAVALMT